jgi:conjugal transfer ATP-binding protein TraC
MLKGFGAKCAQWLGDTPLFGRDTQYFHEVYQQMLQGHYISDFLPYRSVDSTSGLFWNEDSVGFVLETQTLVGASEAMQREMNNIFTHILPDESALQVILWADPCLEGIMDTYQNLRGNSSDTLKTLAENRVAYWRQLVRESPLKPYMARNFRVLICFSMSAETASRAAREAALGVRRQLEATLTLLGLTPRIWGAADLINTLRGMLYGSAAYEEPNIDYDPFTSIADQIGHRDFAWEVDSRGLAWQRGDGRRQGIRTLSVRQYPSTWSLHAMGELIGDAFRDQAQIPCPFMIHYGVYIPSQDKPKAKVMAKASYVERQAYSPLSKFLPHIRFEAEELAFVREKLGQGERIVNTHMGVTLLCPLEDMDVAQQTAMNVFTSKEWRLEPNTYVHLPMFLSSLPLMWSEERVRALLNLHKLKTTLSTESANLLPIQGEWKGTQTPAMLLGGRRGQIMTWSPFDNNAGNYNICVVGRSGSGKSVLMQEIMNSALGMGGRVFIMDLGRSFERACFLLDGQYVEFSAKRPICINPFSGIPVDNPEVAEDALAMIKSILVLMAAPVHGLPDKGVALLEQAMLETWAKYKNDTTITLISYWLLSHTDSVARDIGQMLFPYTAKGTYGRFFEGPSTVNFDRKLVVVELEELKERKDLQAVVVQMFVINITNRMFLGDRQTPFHIVFDEAWDMLRGKQGGAFMETLARRLRKYRGSLVIGTQTINDFYSSAAAQAAFDNSDWMCLLSQKPESIEQLKKTDRLHLSPHKETLLKSLRTKQGEYAEVMISGSDVYAVGRLLLDPYAQLLYSTKPEDYARIQALKAQGLSVDGAILHVLGQSGVHKRIAPREAA